MNTVRWSRWLGAAFGLLMLAALLTAADASLQGHTVPAIPLAAWVMVPLALLVSHAFRAARIHAELSAHASVAFADCLRVGLVHSAAVNVFPMRSGELVYPWLVRQRLRIGTPIAIASLVRMRVQDAVVLGLAAVVLAPIGPLPVRLALAAAGALLIAVALRALRRLPVPTSPRWLAVRTALEGARAGSASGWVYSAGSWSTKLIAIAAMLSILGHLPAAPAVCGALGGELAALSPLQAPAGIGTYEAGVWLGVNFPAVDMPRAEVVLAALLAHLAVWLVTASAALVAWWSWGLTFARPPHPSEGRP